MKKQVLSILIAIVLVAGLMSCFAFSANAAPDTDYTGYYKITNAGQLAWFACLVVGDTSQSNITEAQPDAKAVLTADIDITVLAERFGKTWSGIGTAETPFTGVFDGNGHTIKGLTIDSSLTTPTVSTIPLDTAEQGLFGVIGEGGIVRDVVLQGSASVSDGMKLGAVASVNNGTIENVLSMMTVTGGDAPDAFVHTNNGTVTNSYTDQSGTATGATKVTSDALASGSVAYALGASFGQTIGTDLLPVPANDTNRVYQISADEYSNTPPVTVDSLAAELDAAVVRLEGLIADGDKVNAEELDAAITEVKALVEAAEKAAAEGDQKLETSLSNTTAVLTQVINTLKSDLDSAVEELKVMIEAGDKTNATELADHIAETKVIFAMLERNMADGDDALEQALADAKDTLSQAVETVQANLDKAVSDLNTLIAEGDKANADALTAAIDEVKALITAAEKTAAEGDQKLAVALYNATEALTKAVKTVQDNLEMAVDELNTLIAEGDKANADALAAAIDEVKALIAAAEKTAAEGDQKLAVALYNATEALTKAVKTVQDNLDKAVEDLTKAMEEGDLANAEEIAKQVTILTNMIGAVEQASIERDEALNKSLEDAKTALTNAINTVQANLDKAVEDLNKAIKDGDDKLAAEIAKQVGILTGMINKVESESVARDKALEEALDKAKKELEDAIKALRAYLENEMNKLAAAMQAADKELSTRLAAAVESLSTTIANVELASIAGDEALHSALEEAKAALEDAIDAVQANLDQAVATLNKAVENGDKALDDKIAALDKALKAAETALKAADASNKTELQNAINGAKDELLATIKKGDKDTVDTLMAEIEKLRNEMNEADKSATVLTVILSAVAIIGVAVAIVLIFKRK